MKNHTIITALLSLTACSGTETLCQIHDLEKAHDLCMVGDTVIFTPPQFGNEQYPLIAAALLCKMDNTVVHTNGGVVCTLSPKKTTS